MIHRKRVPQHCIIFAFQNHEEISLFEQCLRGSHNIGVTFHLLKIMPLLS